MGRGDQVGGVRRSLGVSESLLRQSLLEIDTATFARMVSRGLLHGKTFLSRPLTVRIYFKFSVTQFDNVLCPPMEGQHHRTARIEIVLAVVTCPRKDDAGGSERATTPESDALVPQLLVREGQRCILGSVSTAVRSGANARDTRM